MNLVTIPPTDSNQPLAGQVATWLDACEAELLHPGEVEDRARRHGWSPTSASAIVEEYRRRFNEHTLGYSALLVATGVAALAAGTAAHALINGLDSRVNRDELGVWLSILLCCLPFAAWSHWWAARVDRHDPVAVWSRPRRTLAQTLVWACGIVGGIRLIMYMAQLVGVVVGASWARHVSLVVGALNVMTSLAISVPLGLWAFRFLHRFDAEDPTVPHSVIRRVDR